jgi:ribosomal protein S18 acetylase RimI-like enzyme
MGNLTREEFEKDMKINGEFYRAFNKWLAEARNPNPSQSYKIVRIVDPEELSKLRDKVAAYKNFTFSFSSEYIGKLKSHLADKHACQLFAIDEEGTVAGYIASSEALFPDYQWIIELFIDPEFQKKGIATKLMDDTAAWAQSHKLKGLVTETEFKNIPAQKFYEKYGFEKIENPGWKDGFTYQLKFKDSL